MQKKLFALLVIMLLAGGTLGAVYFFKPTKATNSLDLEVTCKKTVDKKPDESFTVEITFKNKGTTEGTWKVAVAFEGDSWTWKGEEKQLTLEAGEKETLTWEGVVPEDAAVDSVARLIVYYDNEFTALNWWIHVIPNAELAIVHSKVS
jgi:hypothetical protein